MDFGNGGGDSASSFGVDGVDDENELTEREETLESVVAEEADDGVIREEPSDASRG